MEIQEKNNSSWSIIFCHSDKIEEKDFGKNIGIFLETKDKKRFLVVLDFFQTIPIGEMDEICVVFMVFRRRMSNKNNSYSSSISQKYDCLDWRN